MRTSLVIAPFLFIVLVGFVFWLWALIDVLRRSDASLRTGTQLLWVVVIVFTQIIGAILYVAMARPTSSGAARPNNHDASA